MPKKALFILLIFASLTTVSAKELISLENGDITFEAPEGFKQLSEKVRKQKFPRANAPQNVIGNETAGTTIAYQLKKINFPPSRLAGLMDVYKKILPRAIPGLSWKSTKMITLAGTKWSYLEFTSTAINADIHNIMLLTSYKNNLLIFNFNSTKKQFPKYESLLRESIQSIKLKKTPVEPRAEVKLPIFDKSKLIKNEHTYVSAALGIVVKKPISWQFISKAESLQNLKQIKLKDKEFEKLIANSADAPIAALLKYKNTYEGLNPSIKIGVKPIVTMGGNDPKKFLELILPSFGKMFKDIKVISKPEIITISGLKTGYLKFYYTLQNQTGDSYPACSELWIIPRGAFYFMIGSGTRQDEKNGSRKEIHDIINNIKFYKLPGE